MKKQLSKKKIQWESNWCSVLVTYVAFGACGKASYELCSEEELAGLGKGGAAFSEMGISTLSSTVE